VKARIDVGEPWDFTGPDGDNIILGNIFIPDLFSENNFAIFIVKNPFYAFGSICKSMRVIPRYQGESIQSLKHKEKLPISASYDFDSTKGVIGSINIISQ
jgi:hypothetical protein